MTRVLDRQLSGWGVDVGSETKRSLLRFARILCRYDKANVIGTRDYDEIVRRHILDSLSCMLFGPLRGAGKIADVGSGGGLPGIPLALVLPGAEVTLFESVGKKVAFLRYAVEELGLTNVRFFEGRVEAAAREREYRESYDVCTARAVSSLSVVAEYCLPLVRVGGRVVAMKGRLDGEERVQGGRASAVLGGRVREEIQVPFLPEAWQGERRLVVLSKDSATPEAYPRKVGTPARDPLGRK